MRALGGSGCLVLAATVLLSGCTGSGTPDKSHTSSTPKPKDSSMQVRKLSDVQQQAKSFADSIAAAAGHPLDGWKTQPAPCESSSGDDAADGPWTLTGVATIPVAPAAQIPTLTRIRDRWQAQGYEITAFRTVPPDNKLGTLSAHVPAQALTVTLESTTPGTALSVVISSGCYAPAPGENPAG